MLLNERRFISQQDNRTLFEGLSTQKNNQTFEITTKPAHTQSEQKKRMDINFLLGGSSCNATKAPNQNKTMKPQQSTTEQKLQPIELSLISSFTPLPSYRQQQQQQQQSENNNSSKTLSFLEVETIQTLTSLCGVTSQTKIRIPQQTKPQPKLHIRQNYEIRERLPGFAPIMEASFHPQRDILKLRSPKSKHINKTPEQRLARQRRIITHATLSAQTRNTILSHNNHHHHPNHNHHNHHDHHNHHNHHVSPTTQRRRIKQKTQVESPTRDPCPNCNKSVSTLWRAAELGGRKVYLCNACGLRFKKGKYCPFCYKVYYDAQTNTIDWLRCCVCSNWSHRTCFYRNCGNNIIAEERLNTSIYKCPNCKCKEHQQHN